MHYRRADAAVTHHYPLTRITPRTDILANGRRPLRVRGARAASIRWVTLRFTHPTRYNDKLQEFIFYRWNFMEFNT